MNAAVDSSHEQDVRRCVAEPLLRSLTRRSKLDEAAFTYDNYSADRAAARHTLTWSELYLRTVAVAARISSAVDADARVAILCPQDLSYPVAFLGALASGAIAVPLFAPEVGSHADRLTGVLGDCEPTVWLTSSAARASTEELLRDPRVTPPAEIVAVDEVDRDVGGDFVLPEIDQRATAYLQYTSGSTRAPAGAAITHRAVTANVQQVADAYDLDADWTSVGWIPFFHDMGLVLLTCLPVGLGMTTVFSTPFDFIRRPRGWLEELSSHAKVITAAPNFAFDYAVDRIKEESRAGLDLSGVRVAINGSEPVRARTVKRFEGAFDGCGFDSTAHRPSYGLAEATVFVSTSGPAGPTITTFRRSELMAGRAVAAHDEVDSLSLVSAGTPAGQYVCIVDPVHHTALDDGLVGEVWVHGPNLASGYWNQPERNKETFNGRLASPAPGWPAAGWLRTGDLGVRFADELYITGRIKDLIIVDGKNHYPQDIEQTVADAHPSIRAGRVAAFGVDTGSDEAIVVVLECRLKGDEAGARTEVELAVRRAVAAAHDLKLLGVQILAGHRVLRTSSGKIARSANRDRYLAEGHGGVA
jgi:fatty acid CoA ligase FadD32